MNSSAESSNSEIEFEVESIEGKRTYLGVTQYLIKWKNYADEENTWEPVANLSCQELIRKYEATIHHPFAATKSEKVVKKRKTPGTVKRETAHVNENGLDDGEMKNSVNGSLQPKITTFTKNGDVECIQNMKRVDGDIKFLVLFKSSDEPEWMPIEAIKKRYPQKVIEFYERCITWQN